jgi:succinyl-diaminopimelate desuccinylase
VKPSATTFPTITAIPSSAARPVSEPESARRREAEGRRIALTLAVERAVILAWVQEQTLAERLITYDTSTLEGVQAAAGFVKGWLEARDLEVKDGTHNGLPVIAATVGADHGPTVIFHGHLDVVPGFASQFEPRIDGDRLFGRGAYDMKGGLAAMMCATRDLAAQTAVKVHFVCVSDEESDEADSRGSDYLVEKGYTGDFAITGEPTDLLIGIQAKGVLALRIEVRGKSAHGSTPWLGDNAVLKAVDVFRQIGSMPFARESSEMFDRPSVSLGRIMGGDAMNKVPDRCVIDVDIRFLPGQDADALLGDIEALPDSSVQVVFRREPAMVDRDNPFVAALAESVADGLPAERISVGRDGASDIVSFLEAGTPGVEFGPTGGGHHGPDEWVSITSLDRYHRALVDFVTAIPKRLGTAHLRIA